MQKIHNDRLLGAITEKDSVRFRVWAPFASYVGVAGTFNGWDKKSHPLENEKNGYWSGKVSSAKPGDEYKFVIRNGDREFLKNDPYARQINQERLNSVILDSNFEWKEKPFKLPSFNQLAVYELHVGTFNTKKDGTPGKLDEVTKRLPYLKELGVNVIELMPVSEFPTTLSWGYNPTNPFAVELSYGGADALRKLVAAAHEQGIGIVVDVVYNHFGPQDLDLWQFDGWSENNLGGIYFFNDWRAWTPWGENRPDYGRGEVRQYIRDNALMWFEEFHVDGLRFDGTGFIRNTRSVNNDPGSDIPEGWTLLQWINDEVKKHFPGRITIAEDMQKNEWLVKETGAGGAGFDTQWDAGFVHPIRKNVIVPQDSERNMGAIIAALTNRYNGDAFKRVIYSESHDEVANGRARVTTEINPDDPSGFFAKKRSTLAAGLVFTSPGIPMIFEGQEILEDGWFRDEEPLHWQKLDAFQGINKLYRDLIHLRLNKTGKTRGLCGQSISVYHVHHQMKICAFHRWMNGGAEDDVIVVANFANLSLAQYEIGFPRPGKWNLRLDSGHKYYSSDFGKQETHSVETVEGNFDGMSQHGTIAIGPYSVLIFSQDKV